MNCPDCNTPAKSWQETCVHCGADFSHKPVKHREGSQPIWTYYPVR